MVAIANLVHQQSTTTGTSDFTLTAMNGKQSFNTAFGTGGSNVFYYFIMNQSAAEFEYGTGHLSSSTVLVRDTVIGGTNSTSLVNFSAGTKDVCCDIEASKQIINPLTTRGDILVRDASVAARLALGANFKTLQSNGTDPAWGDAPILLTSGNITSSATTLDIVMTSYTAFSAWLIIGKGFMPTTDQVLLYLRLSTDGGSTYVATNSYHHRSRCELTGGDASGGGQLLAQISPHGTNSTFCCGNVSGEGCDFELLLFDPGGTTHYTSCNYAINTYNGTPNMGWGQGSGILAVKQDIDALRFLWSSGNFNGSTPGSYKIYGIP